MKTLQNIREEIEAIKSQADGLRAKKSQDKKADRLYKKLGKERKLLYECQLYLESSPREEFVRKMLKDLQDQLKRIDEGFSDWLPTYTKVGNEDCKKTYLKIMETAEKKKQIKVLKLILQ